MSIPTESYTHQAARWPRSGRHILARYSDDEVVVYQAYRPDIGHYAVRHQAFGGAFSYERMSWVKPNFLWMMYRSGWGTKRDQEVTLAIHLERSFFDAVLAQAVHSSFVPEVYGTRAEWQQRLRASPVRLQWDPDHGPMGGKQERRAIQLGLRGPVLQTFGTRAIRRIEDISDFVAAARPLRGDHDALCTPLERVYRPADEAIGRHLGLELDFDVSG